MEEGLGALCAAHYHHENQAMEGKITCRDKEQGRKAMTFDDLDEIQKGNLFDDLQDLFREYGWGYDDAHELAVAAFEAVREKDSTR